MDVVVVLSGEFLAAVLALNLVSSFMPVHVTLESPLESEALATVLVWAFVLLLTSMLPEVAEQELSAVKHLVAWLFQSFLESAFPNFLQDAI